MWTLPLTRFSAAGKGKIIQGTVNYVLKFKYFCGYRVSIVLWWTMACISKVIFFFLTLIVLGGGGAI